MINRNDINKAMSEKEQHKKPENEESSLDEDLDSLSQDEKAAFEKIMAEIAAGGEKPPLSDGAPGIREGEPPAAVPPTPQAMDRPSTDSEQPDDGPAAPVTRQGADHDKLNDEQQAALDQIMAEIHAQDQDAQPGVEDTPAPQEDASLEEDSLTDDQQAALDQIMAEINGQSADSTEDSMPEESQRQASDKEMSEDQQAALDQIMAEIEAKKGGKSAEGQSDGVDEEEVQQDSADSSDTLPDDQQAALDQIMAEIESKRNRAENSPTSEESSREAEPPAEQDAELTAVMDQIAESKPANHSEPASPDTPPMTSLSMDEFDDELSQLLASPESKPEPRKKALTSADSGSNLSPLTAATPVAESGPHRQGEAGQQEIDPEHKEPMALGDDQSQTQAASSGTDPDHDYPILQEVDPAAGLQNTSSKSKPALRFQTPPGSPSSRKRRRLKGVVLLLVVSLLAAGAYWGYAHKFGRFGINALRRHALSPSNDTPRKQTPAADHSSQTTSVKPQPAARQESPNMSELDVDPLVTLKARLSQAREMLQAKMASIEDLKAYYRKGVAEDTSKLQAELKKNGITTYDKAIADKKIELILRSIQRRTAYMNKLDTPLHQLASSSEALLYLERRSQLYEALIHRLSGLPLDAFRSDVEKAVDHHLQENKRLSIDEVQVQPPSLEAIWKQHTSRAFKNSHQKEGTGEIDPRNRAIGQEICQGHFENKYQLTELSAQTAQCLLQWGGRDMYLNELRHLWPSAAKILAQWPGESLGLNGLTELPDASAKYISQWPGKRLSLNGLTRLSPQATDDLSHWKGEQLEMIGLQSIGRWENYGTRLFLSEKLRRQLEHP